MQDYDGLREHWHAHCQSLPSQRACKCIRGFDLRLGPPLRKYMSQEVLDEKSRVLEEKFFGERDLELLEYLRSQSIEKEQ